MPEIEIREGPHRLSEVDPDAQDWVESKPALRVDLACGLQKREGFIGIDYVDLSAQYPDFIQHDLSIYPWPFEDSTVYELNCSHYVEHLGFEEGKDLIAFMDECYRILQPGGTIQITFPYGKSDRAIQDPTHKRFINEITFNYFSKKWREEAKVSHYHIKCDFETLSNIAIIHPAWNSRAEEAKRWAVTHLWNVVQDMIVTLRARK